MALPNSLSLSVHVHKCGQHFSMPLIPFDLTTLHKKPSTTYAKDPEIGTFLTTPTCFSDRGYFSRPHWGASESVSLSASKEARPSEPPGGFWERNQVPPRPKGSSPWVTVRLQFPESPEPPAAGDILPLPPAFLPRRPIPHSCFAPSLPFRCAL